MKAMCSSHGLWIAVRHAAQIDKDGDGKISRDELAEAMRAINDKMSDQEIADMLKHADSDPDGDSWKDGEVSLEEFVMLMLFKQPVAA